MTSEQQKERTEKENKIRNTQITFRIFQAIFFGILALGISSIFGDFNSYMKSPISAFSITTTIFGLIGSIMTGILANKSKDW
jgi:uncharacterized protein YacL